MIEQATLGLTSGRTMPARPTLVLYAEGDWVVAHYVDFDLTARFPSWSIALDVALHPVNNHVVVKVRAHE